MSARALTREDVIRAGLPAWSDDLVYRFVPGEGFQRASLMRFAPAWILTTVPPADTVWCHEDACDCSLCLAPPAVIREPREPLAQAV
jgi:hypothetical protein